MSYPPETSRSSHEADGRSDRSGGSGGAASGSGGGVYGTLCSAFGGKWPTQLPSNPNEYSVDHGPQFPSSTPHERLLCNWKKWSLGLDYLLQDSEGVSLFKSYLQYEGCANLLDFWFACQGFRSKVDPSDNRKITQLIKVIYRTYIRGASCSNLGISSSPLVFLGKSQSGSVMPQRNEPIRLRSETRHAITERISRKHALDQTVFDSAQAEVEQFLRTTAYPAFLKSDIYVDFLQKTLDGSQRKPVFTDQLMPACTSSGSFSTDRPVTNLPECSTSMHLGGKFLPTLDEDRELKSEELCSTDPTRTKQQTCKPHHYCDPNISPDSLLMPHGHGHCQHCAQCYMQNFYHPCAPNERPFSPYPYQGLRPPWACQSSAPTGAAVSTGSGSSGGGGSVSGTGLNLGAAPLTVENIQMTRFYRAELSLQHPYPNASHSPQIARTSQHQQTQEPRRAIQGSRLPGGPHNVRHFQGHPNYVYTHWPDNLCPASVDLQRSATRLPSQPPNPYHISYAPVSARDSEHHSLSSEARTDDTHSQTDSSHDGAMNRLRQHSLHHRYSSPFQSSRSQKPPTAGQSSQLQQQQQQQQQPTPPPVSAMVQPLHRRGVQYPGQLTESHGDTSCRPFTGPFSPPSGLPADRSAQKHQRRAMRRNMALRAADKNKTGADGTTSGGHMIKSSKSSSHSYNLAEHDPAGFARVLSDKLQRLLDSQMATERLDHLMTDVSPNYPDSKEPSDKQDFTTTTTTTTGTTTSTTISDKRPQDAPSKPELVSNLTMGNLPSSAQRTVGVGSSSSMAPSVLQRPWADKLLAAARVQHENTKDNAQAILEDHCSRIWAASADRTPTSSGSGSGGGGVGSHTNQDVAIHPTLGDFTTTVEPPPQTPDYAVRFPGEHNPTRLTGDSALFDSAVDPPGGCLSPGQPKPQQHHSHHHQHTRLRKRAPPEMLMVQSFEESRPGGQLASDGSNTGHATSGGDQWNASAISVHSIGRGPSTTGPATAAAATTTSETSWVCQFEATSDLSFDPVQPNTQPQSKTALDQLSEPQSPMGSRIDGATAGPPAPVSATTSHYQSQSTPASQSTHSSSISALSATTSNSTPGGSVVSPAALVIGYYLGDDPVPYRSLWPSTEITLGQFKQLIPKKKGLFRYFFKKASDEFGSGVVHQEITNDDTILPLWEGKVVAKVERVD